VELLDGGRQRLELERIVRRVGDELDAIADLATPDLEDEDDRPARTRLETECIAVALGDRLHLVAPVAHGLDGADRVAQVRGALEALVGRGFTHLLAQVLDELVLTAFDEELRLVHRAAVLIDRADRVHARREAPLDVVFEAGTVTLA